MSGRAVLFDLDGTLVDSAPAIAAALSQVRIARGAAPISAEQVRPWISLGAPELVRLALGGAAREPSADLEAMRSALRELPTPPDSLYPGVVRLLQALQAGGLRLAVVTNKPEALARKLLDELALSAYFDAVVGGDSTPHPKPHPAPLRAALMMLDVPAAEAVLVGDSAVDAAAAEGMALPFHLFEGGYGAAECDGYRVSSRFATHAELRPLLLAARREAV